MKAIRSNRSGLFLIEMVIVILFFSLTSAICVRLFAEAALTSSRGSELNRAVLITESAAEAFKSAFGDRDALCAILGGEPDGEDVFVYYDKDFLPVSGVQNAFYRLAINLSSGDEIVSAHISLSKVSAEDAIYSLDAKIFTGKGAL